MMETGQGQILPRRIAMWSGPRNISTAMMRSWENRPDTTVHDEPFYAHYLKQTGYDHPGAAEIIATMETDWQVVVQTLTGNIPDGKTIYYQKHMTHHILPHIDITWILSLSNAFLIRDPHEMLLSYIKVRPNLDLAETGLPQQVQLFNYVKAQTGITPPVIDARDVLENPRRVLSLLCAALDIPFTEAMLHWSAGKRSTDGIWAKYWYSAVEKSTDFAPYKPRTTTLPDNYSDLLIDCEGLYQQMAAHRLQ